jgi:hypothetical protein
VNCADIALIDPACEGVDDLLVAIVRQEIIDIDPLALAVDKGCAARAHGIYHE